MELLEFIFSSFYKFWGFLILSYAVVGLPILRIIRVINIKINGWPPDHLDADSDFKLKDLYE